MSGTDIEGKKLVELYHRYVGEPATRRDVYGYWIFVVGAIVGLAGVLVYQIEQAFFATNLAMREIAIVFAAGGMPLALLGIIVLLPVRRRGIQVSLLGVAISLVGVYLFTLVYPTAWYVGPDYSAEIIAVYTVGIALLAAVAMLVPILTGEKGFLVAPELGIGSDSPPLLVGEEDRDAFFSVYKTKSRDWTWRIIQRGAIAESGQPAPTDTDARLIVENVRPELGRAGLLEITSSAFRLYPTASGGWRWTLMREDGSVLATNDTDYSSRDEVEEAVSVLKEEGPDAGMLDIRSAAFDVYELDDRWYWRLLDDSRRVLARTTEQFRDESTAIAGTDRFVQSIGDARVLGIETIAIELFEESTDEWRWRIVTTDDDTLAMSHETSSSRRDAESTATRVSDHLQDATVVDLTTAGYELFERTNNWEWRLRTETDEIIATSHVAYSTPETVKSHAERVNESVLEADILEYDLADYEVYPDQGAWRWRLVTIDRTIVAESTQEYDDREAASIAAELVRDQADVADLIEFEHAAFQQYESGDEWRWRLIDEDGRVMTDSGEEYASKRDVRDAMTTLKEHAPNAEVLEIDTAAFEIHRTDDDAYAWRLIDETGRLVATGSDRHERREAAREDVDFVRSTAESTDIRTMSRAAFQIYTDADDEWHWRLIAPDGVILAVGPTRSSTRDDVLTAIEEVRDAGTSDTIDVVGDVSVQLRRNGAWHWRLVDADRAPLAVGERTYSERADATTDIVAVTDHARDAPMFELGAGVVWIDRADPDVDTWRWRFIDADRKVIARSEEPFDGREDALDAVETVRARIPDAEVIAFEGAVFELYRDEDTAWRWRLLAEDETILAASAVAYDQRRDAESTLEDVREVVPKASILEIEDAAYELHRRNGGWIWRLVDENGTGLVESVKIHQTRKAARDEMNEVKQYAPNGEITVTR